MILHLANAVSSFVSTQTSQLIHLSGQSNIGTLQLSGNLIVGTGKAFAQNQTTIGINNYAGARCFYADLNLSRQNESIAVVDADLSALSSLVGEKYSCYAQSPGLNYGTVMSAFTEYEGKTSLSLVPFNDNILRQNAQAPIFFTSRPELGNVTAGAYSMAIGRNANAFGYASLAQGLESTAGKYAFASGKEVVADWASLASGNRCSAVGVASHAQGRSVFTDQYCSQVEGFANIVSAASGQGMHAACSHVIGTCATSKNPFSFVWSGKNNSVYVDDNGNLSAGNTNYDRFCFSLDPYTSHGIGTFNINPLSGADGMFIGEKTLTEVISEKAKPLSGMAFTSSNTLEEIISAIAVALGATVDFSDGLS